MKKLIMILLLIGMAFSASAQWYYRMYGVTSLDSLPEKQLNFCLQKSLGTIKTGKTMTIVGASLFVGGLALFLSGYSASETNPEGGAAQAFTGALLVDGGIIVGGIGIGYWIVGFSRKKDIKLALVKFEGSASINGIGLTVYF
jgi:hypothetical protein